METLVATVLIVIIFMLTSMILNNVFYNSVKNNTRDVEVYLKELQYLYKNKKLALPYHTYYNQWEIHIDLLKENRMEYMEVEATRDEKTITSTIRANRQ